MRDCNQDDRNYVIACYAGSLIQGETLLAKAIKTDTIKRYLYAAATFSLAEQVVDPRLDFFGKESHHITKVLSAHKHWEDIPNRREPVTEQMLHEMLKTNPHDDSLESALYDWNIMGHYYGYRKSEWVQDSKNLRKRILQRLPNGDVQAFRRDDFIFHGKDGIRIAQGDSVTLEDTPDIHEIACRWRYQKNTNNGEIKTQARNDEHPELCPVRAALRIRRRSQRCAGITAADPIAVFINRHGKPQYIDDALVNKYLQQIAKTVYKITDKTELARWTCHSLRVGACMTLFNQGKDESFIMFQLRWRSKAWMTYIRDSPHLSTQHIKAFNTSWNAMLNSLAKTA